MAKCILTIFYLDVSIEITKTKAYFWGVFIYNKRVLRKISKRRESLKHVSISLLLQNKQCRKKANKTEEKKRK